MNKTILLLTSLLLSAPLASAASTAPAAIQTTQQTVSTQPSTTQSLDLSTPAKTIHSFAAAIDAFDLPSAQQCVVDDPAQQALVAQLISTIVTFNNFKAAAFAKFPVESASTVKEMPDTSLSTDLLGGVIEKIDPAANTAIVSKSPSNTADLKPFGLRKIADNWKIDLTLTPNGRESLQQAPNVAQITRLFDLVTANIRANQYKSWNQVENAMNAPQTQPAPSSSN